MTETATADISSGRGDEVLVLHMSLLQRVGALVRALPMFAACAAGAGVMLVIILPTLRTHPLPQGLGAVMVVMALLAPLAVVIVVGLRSWALAALGTTRVNAVGITHSWLGLRRHIPWLDVWWMGAEGPPTIYAGPRKLPFVAHPDILIERGPDLVALWRAARRSSGQRLLPLPYHSVFSPGLWLFWGFVAFSITAGYVAAVGLPQSGPNDERAAFWCGIAVGVVIGLATLARAVAVATERIDISPDGLRRSSWFGQRQILSSQAIVLGLNRKGDHLSGRSRCLVESADSGICFLAPLRWRRHIRRMLRTAFPATVRLEDATGELTPPPNGMPLDKREALARATRRICLRYIGAGFMRLLVLPVTAAFSLSLMLYVGQGFSVRTGLRDFRRARRARQSGEALLAEMS